MKKSIKAIAAFSAALTMTFSCIPKAFAVEDVPTVHTEADEEKTGLEFAEGKFFEVPYNGIVMFADSDGTVYYRSCDSGDRLKIFTLDEDGKVKKSFDIKSYTDDNGVKVEPMNFNLKQCGNNLYFIYTEASGSWWHTTKKGNVIIKLDKELNEIERYSYKKGRSVDTNGEKVVYLKDDNNICICDIDGKNLKTIYTTNKSGDEFEQPLNGVAIAGDYIGFQKRTGYSNEPNRKAYCGMINIETGEITLKEQRSVEQVFSSGDNLIWYGSDGYYPDDDDSSFTFSSDPVANDAYFNNRYKYYDDNELYIFDGENYSVLKTKNKGETGYGAIVDNAGNLITQSFDRKGHVIFRIYRDGKLIGEHTTAYKGYSCFTANNGKLTICYTGRNATADDWIGYDPETTTLEELQEQLDKTPAAKDTIKSVTIYYK